MRHINTLVGSVALLAAAPALATGQERAEDYKEKTFGPYWVVMAQNPHIIGEYGDNFAYDGENVREANGVAYLNLNSKTNEGWAMATFHSSDVRLSKGEVLSGDFTIFYPEFRSHDASFQEGGVADYTTLHGATGHGAPVLPATPAYVASWGPAMLYVDGELKHMGVGHTMLTERVRDEDSDAVYADESKGAYYTPKRPRTGTLSEPDEESLHFLFRSQARDSTNVPPFEQFLHLNYYWVEVGPGDDVGAWVNAKNEIPARVRAMAERMQREYRAMVDMREGSGR